MRKTNRSLESFGVVFDIGDTLISIDELRFKAVSRILVGAPETQKAEMISRLFSEFDKAADRRRYNNFLFGLPGKAFEASIARNLGKDQVAALVFGSRYRQEIRSLLKPDRRTIATLNRLREKGIKIGILSDGTVEEMADAVRLLGIANYCAAVGISQALRAVKPEPKAFKWMSESLEIPAHRLVMVGDDLTADIRGAVSVGWKAIWVDGEREAAPTGVPCIARSRFDRIPTLVEGLLP